MKSSGEPYYRRITLRPTVLGEDGKTGRIEAHMQDHVHHMKVVINHEDGRVVSAVPQGRAAAVGHVPVRHRRRHAHCRDDDRAGT